MQKEYKNAIEQISLRESDKARILANVKKACENKNTDTAPDKAEAVPFRMRPKLSLRRMGAVAACLIVLAGAAGVYRSSLLVSENSGVEWKIPVQDQVQSEETVWEELSSIEEISEKTDCKTYTLGNVPRAYRLKKIEVARKQRHVRITYKSKKKNDKILFEYKEKDSGELLGQFKNDNTLSTKRVGKTNVTLYGKKKCNAMTWKKKKYTFVVRMTRARTQKEARAIVSGTKEGIQNLRSADRNKIEMTGSLDSQDANQNVIGWYGDETPMDENEVSEFLEKMQNLIGFSVAVGAPAERVCYKQMEHYETMLFYYQNDVKLEDKRIIVYAGEGGCPDGVMDGYDLVDTVYADGVEAAVYRNVKKEKLLQFEKEEVVFTIVLENYTGKYYEDILKTLVPVFTVARPQKTEQDPETDAKENVPEKNESKDAADETSVPGENVNPLENTMGNETTEDADHITSSEE